MFLKRLSLDFLAEMVDTFNAYTVFTLVAVLMTLLPAIIGALAFQAYAWVMEPVATAAGPCTAPLHSLLLFTVVCDAVSLLLLAVCFGRFWRVSCSLHLALAAATAWLLTHPASAACPSKLRISLWLQAAPTLAAAAALAIAMLHRALAVPIRADHPAGYALAEDRKIVRGGADENSIQNGDRSAAGAAADGAAGSTASGRSGAYMPMPARLSEDTDLDDFEEEEDV
jgi:hypothetical protein